MLPRPTTIAAACRASRPRYGAQHRAARWLMAAMLVVTSWGSGSVIPVRLVVGGAGTSGPVVPTEEHESHSSTPLVVDARGGDKRTRTVQTRDRRTSSLLKGASSAVPQQYAMPLRGSCDGHRLANGLMAPMQT